ncbi:MAG: hypothetical protein VX791_18955 [Pseudomonadota bacterium]|nr:hypothetical protein [Pseudomonadota bacterium]
MATDFANTNAGVDPIDGSSLTMISGDDLAKAMLFSGVTGRFRSWCREIGIRPVPGRHNVYDPKHVRQCLDVAQGIANVDPVRQQEPMSLVEQRRLRRAGA